MWSNSADNPTDIYSGLCTVKVAFVKVMTIMLEHTPLSDQKICVEIDCKMQPNTRNIKMSQIQRTATYL